MIRLHAVVEGQTEETFVNKVLAPELGLQGVSIRSRCITTGRGGIQGRREDQVFRGGIRSYSQLKTDLEIWMRQDRQPDAWFTTMIDVFGLPTDFPGYSECQDADAIRRATCLEAHLERDLSHQRFLPYLQLYEFEALLFSDPSKFENEFPGDAAVIPELFAIRSAFPTPEHINDHPDLAPSKRILKLLPDYRKPVSGPLVAGHIGLATIRRECRHFDRWIQRIEQAASV